LICFGTERQSIQISEIGKFRLDLALDEIFEIWLFEKIDNISKRTKYNQIIIPKFPFMNLFIRNQNICIGPTMGLISE
jgi:hypothetical protein